MGSQFVQVKEAAPIEVFLLSEECRADTDEHKVNLTVGAYRTNEGKPWVLPCVRSVELSMAADEQLNKEYLPITGEDSFVVAGMKLVLGAESPLISSRKADGCQALGGTGAIYLALQFLVRVMKCKTVYVSDPTWPNHKSIAALVGLEIRTYKYWDPASRAVCFTGLMKDLKEAPKGAVVILHACAHNPTGMDLDRIQWSEVMAVVKVPLQKLKPMGSFRRPDGCFCNILVNIAITVSRDDLPDDLSRLFHSLAISNPVLDADSEIVPRGPVDIVLGITHMDH
ncbi:Aspartate aminotransferase [Fasciolopsis buskii]|uniref:aspartate transaminase n=1 Tax=Fasciolopsis buskii TaxID=27845 RepID=A0A8E0VJT4_9TREM|nr:Aspartate aminotransferase [Fasciolopsis buski]